MQRLKQLHAPSSLITVSSVGDIVRFAFLTSTFHVTRLFRSFYRNFFFVERMLTQAPTFDP